ncbi:DNA ligase [Vibrio sp. 16]|uniref:DNA ligase n=1 Tax=Vibrio sp. 16 TaxID=391586 RepID=UPI00018F29F6|nr:DNA ligase [Vibrio sp. 16]EED26107.1 DNA ligase [Vibrio sp. 16]CAK4068033.1 DNA ligase [Vibrio sp. 16]
MNYQLTSLAASVLIALSMSANAANVDDFLVAVPLAHSYDQKIEVSEYWKSEKLDGIRAIWTGKRLVTRNGNPIHAPDWFVEPLPPYPLEGELWAGRGNFHLVQQTVLDTKPTDAAWRKIDYMLFDMPEAAGDYQKRYHNVIYFTRASKRDHIKYIEHTPIKSETELFGYLDSIDSAKGEGVMLRKITSRYQAGRSNDLLKLKKHQDAEARVVGYKVGRGKYHGLMGALLVQLDSGIKFYIGSGFSDIQRKDPPELGSVITFRYNGYTQNGVPKFARFVRERVE